MITPASNNQIKQWRKLLMGKYRNMTGLFIAEGIRCVEQILHNGFVEIDEILVDKPDLVHLLDIPESLPVFELASDDFASISDTKTPQGVMAVCRVPKKASVDDIAVSEGVIVALDAIQDPGNMGTIIRTAAWFGARAILFGKGCADPFQPKVVRSTAGATGAVHYIRGDFGNIFHELESTGWQVYLLDGSKEAEDLRSVKTAKKSILVAGNEATGISRGLFTANRTRVRIPGHSGIVESLNAAVACGIALEHFSGLS
ncbi:MAG: RNA methyltransferase [Balneolaceae bacterium]|nr:MAG: RNA methyltransferase [Balneolaceae bacterium]